MNYNFLNWTIEIYVYIFIMICWAISATLLGTLFDFSYLHKIYSRSWNMSYITDIKPVLKDEPCPSDYGWEKISIGAWSGFNEGCLCSNTFYSELDSGEAKTIPREAHFYVTDKGNCGDVEDQVREMYPSCTEIPYVRPYMMHTYKGHDFCAHYSNRNYFLIAEAFNNFLESKIDIDDSEFKAFYTNSEQVSMLGYIGGNAVTDIKFINTTLTDLDRTSFLEKHGIDLDKYERKQIKFDYVMLIKRLDKEDESITSNGLKTMRKLISDIHLSNDLWCAYLDIAVPYKKLNPNSGHIDFGYKYCDDFYTDQHKITNKDGNHYIISHRKELFYQDDYFRTTKINFEETVNGHNPSKYDFYNWNEQITKYYNSLLYRVINSERDHSSSSHDERYKEFFIENGNNPSHYSPMILDGSYGPKFDPVLVYENFLEGIGCFKFRDPEEHLDKLDSHDMLKQLCKLLVASNSLVFIFLVVNTIIRCFENKKLTIGIYALILLFTFIGFLAAAIAGTKMRGLRNYMKDYQFYCQNDFTLNYSSSTLPMEIVWVRSLGFSLAAVCVNAAVLFFAMLLEVIFLVRLCFTREQPKKQTEIIEFQHKPIDDQSDFKSKVAADLSSTYRKDDEAPNNQIVE